MTSFPSGVSLFALLPDGEIQFPRPTIQTFSGWQSQIAINGGHFNLTVAPHSDGRWFAGVIWIGEGEINLHLAIRVDASFNGNAYTLVPGALYNGNNGLPINDIPTLASGKLEIPFSECTVPIALHFDGNESGLALAGAPRCQQGWCGCMVDQKNGALWHIAPVKAARRYRHKSWDDLPRPSARLRKHGVVSTWFRVDPFPAGKPDDLFRRLFEHHRSVHGHPRHGKARQSLKSAAHLVGDWMYRRHRIDLGGKPCLLNAFQPSSKNQPGDPDFPLDWYQITGWCGGPMTAFGLLAQGGEKAGYAVQNLDFLASDAPGNHGLARPIFDGRRWHDDFGGDGTGGCSIRIPADFCTFLLRAALSEEANGRPRPDWKKAARTGLEALCSLWEKHHDFGYMWDLSKAEPEPLLAGGTTGAFVLLALAEGLRAWPDDERLLRTALEAASGLSLQAQSGRCRGGPLDILQADDSESAAALSEALLRLWQITGQPHLLNEALVTARIFASWVLPWSPPFPPGSALEGLDICGGVLANVQNRHVGPGICTSSGKFLNDLSEATGDVRWAEIYSDVLAAAINCVPIEEGEMLGLARENSNPWSAVAPGMLTEQINVADCLNQAGEFWPVSASWGMTSLLLAWAERPDGGDAHG